jgi:hypothetical protein
MEGPPKPSSIASWSVTLRPFGYFGSIGYVNALPLGSLMPLSNSSVILHLLFSQFDDVSGLAIRYNSALKQKLLTGVYLRLHSLKHTKSNAFLEIYAFTYTRILAFQNFFG